MAALHTAQELQAPNEYSTSDRDCDTSKSCEADVKYVRRFMRI